MRLAQLARKVNKNQDEIRRFIEGAFDSELNRDPNLKLDEKHVDAVIEKFEVKVEEIESEEIIAEKVEIPETTPKTSEVVNEKVEEKIIEKAAAIEEVNASAEEIVIPEATDIKEEAVLAEDKEDVSETDENSEDSIENSTENDTNTELDPFIARAVDPNAELIKAPKASIEGFKVVGKIDLPENKVEEEVAVEEEVTNSTETELEINDGEEVVDELEASMQAANQDIKTAEKVVSKEVKENSDQEEESSPFKDEKGIYHFSKEQLDNRKKFLELKSERERTTFEKEKKKRHYKELMAATQKPSVKAKKEKIILKKVAKKSEKIQQEKEKPTTLWGKFLYWLND